MLMYQTAVSRSQFILLALFSFARLSFLLNPPSLRQENLYSGLELGENAAN